MKRICSLALMCTTIPQGRRKEDRIREVNCFLGKLETMFLLAVRTLRNDYLNVRGCQRCGDWYKQKEARCPLANEILA